MLSGPPTVTLPALSGWKRSREPGDSTDLRRQRLDCGQQDHDLQFDADPAGQHAVLFIDDYGFHYRIKIVGSTVHLRTDRVAAGLV
jgi:hypothetical protein